MPMSNTVVYRDLDSSSALTETIDKKLKKLNRYFDNISSSRVVLDTPHQHKHKGKLFRAQIELGIKGSPVTVHHDDPSIHVAVRDAFKAAERKLKAISDKRHSKHVSAQQRMAMTANNMDSTESAEEELH